jgi:hypothetical protein
MQEMPEELQQRIAAYIDGELSPAEAARLEVYLANTDPALADSVVGMLSDKVQVRALPKRQAPADLSGRIMEQIERESLLREEDPGARRRWWQSRAAVAAGLAVVLGGFSYFVASSVSRPAADRRWTAAEAPKGGPAAKALEKKEVSPQDGVAVADAEHDRMKGAETASGDSVRGGQQLAAAPAAAAVPAPAKVEAPAAPVALEAAPARAVAVAPATAAVATAPAVAAAAKPDGTFEQAQTLAAAVPNPAPNMGAFAGGGGMGGGGFGGGGGAGGMAGGRGGRGGAGGAAGGGFGGGMGGMGGAGRGGGGRMGGRAAATPAPIVTSGVQSMAPTADNQVRTLAMLTRDGSGPMVVTFIARDAADYSKLATSLANYAGGQAATANVNGIAGGQIVGGGAAASPEVRPNMQMQATPTAPSGTRSQSGGTLTADEYANFNLNKEGVVVVDNAAGGSQVAAGQAVRGLQSDAANRISTYNQQSAPGTATAPLASSLAGADMSTYQMQLQNVQQATAKGGPYRITLRAEQLEELSRTYRLAAVARGDTVVQFQTIGAKSPEAADATARKDLLRRAGLESVATSGSASGIAKATNGPTTASAELECVITMEPNPSMPTAASPPSNRPQQQP